MATFFTKITLNKISDNSDGKKHNKRFEGEFFLDIEELNILRKFTFLINEPNSKDGITIINKDDKPFVTHLGKPSIDSLSEYKPEERLIIISFWFVFFARMNWLNPEKYALTKINRVQIGGHEIVSVETATPDKFRNHFTRACL